MPTPREYVSKAGVRTWRVRFRAHGKETSETFYTRADADRFCRLIDALGPADALEHLLAGDAGETAVPTLDQIAADHFAVLTDVTDGTRLNYQRLWDRTWGARIGRLPADAISRDVVAKAVIDLAKTYSAKSLRNQRGLLSGVCDRAVDQGHLQTNPAKGLRLPRSGEHERGDMRLISEDEFYAILDRLPDRYQPLVTFLYGMGCRWGEAVALTVADVNLPNVRIRRALKWSPDSHRTIGPTKTAKSNRTIIAPAPVVEALAPLLEGRKGDELVFTAPRGGPVQHRTFWSDVWLPAVTAAGLKPRPRIHDLRHSHASNLLAVGVPIHVVQARLGHSDINTTVGTYGHLLPDAQMQAARAAELAFRRPPEIEG